MCLKNRISFLRIIGLATGWLLLCNYPGQAYQVIVNGQAGTATTISSVLGEARPTSSSSGTPFTPNRFHQGADIAAVNTLPLKGGDTVYSIETGQVVNGGICTPTMPCAGSLGLNPYVEVQSLSDPNHVFTYVHINPSSSLYEGEIVSTTTELGTILPFRSSVFSPHLHLNDIETINGTPYDLNPLRPGALDFTDYNPPQFQIPQTIYPGTTNAGLTALIPVPDCPAADCPNGPGSNLSPQTFNQTYNPTDNSYVVPAKPVDLLLTGTDGNPNVASLERRGLYEVALYAAPVSDSFDIRYSHSFSFDSILEGNPSSGVLDLYLQRNALSDTYFATSLKDNEPSPAEAEDGVIDLSNTSLFPDGEYQICADIDGIPGAVFALSAENCVNIVVSRGPTIALTQRGAPGTILSTAPAVARMFV